MKKVVFSYCLIFLSLISWSNSPTNYIPDIFFTSGSSELDSNGLESIQQFVDFLNECPIVQKIEIEGHQDSLELGSADTSLSWKRTQSVIKEIKKNYTGRCIFTCKSYGSSQLLGFDTTELYSVNRCVKFKITKVAKPVIQKELVIDSNNRVDTSALVSAINRIKSQSTNQYLIYYSVPYFLTEEEYGTFNKKTGLRYESLRSQILYLINAHFNSPKIIEESFSPSAQMIIRIYPLD